MTNPHYYDSSYHLGNWQFGLNREVKTQVDNIRNAYRKGAGPGGQLKPYESTVAALILLLDITDRDTSQLAAGVEAMGAKINNLQAALETSAKEQESLRKQLHEALQPKVGGSVGQSVPSKPAATGKGQGSPAKRKTTGNSPVVGK